ncbi:hypothetical protein BTA51_15630 [Hahella sp. CCB-MM4]|uniref:DUF2288 domain-containing protein n=1 Tax=Hahella sp. (strain CCB-MM4) TaxID=1926491 RepID=UPI000B9AD327|nr:DUF2288 family protein [Hahella sp. CCB-MM4]OZG72546.1 hypothetical protein BTA51_15630 [Hahella sp. CCB-MM4]
MSTDNTIGSDDERKAKLLGETSRINWRDLEIFYAKGQVVEVQPELDLIEVALAVSKDDSAAVGDWMNQQKVGQVDPDKARRWHEEKRGVWAVVVAPWVLVQDKESSSSIDPEY